MVQVLLGQFIVAHLVLDRTTGIGYETAKVLARRSATVVLGHTTT